MKSIGKIQNILSIAGGVLLLVGAMTYITGSVYSFYIYAVGALCFSGVQIWSGYDGDNIVVKRLRFQQVVGAILLLCTAVFMAMQTFDFGFARRNEWMVCLSIACVLELYTAFRLPSELEKEQKRK